MPKRPDSKKAHWWQLWRLLKRINRQALENECKDTEYVASTLKDWQRALDQLQPIVRNMRNDIDDLDVNKISFDILGAGTFLLQIDLLLIKIRQHYNNYDRRMKELNLSIPQIEDIMHKAEHQCKMCYINMQRLHKALENRTYHDLNHQEVINKVHNLEGETKTLTECMHALNEIALKRDPLYQLFENELFKTLMELENGPKDPMTGELTITSSNTSGLRDKAHHILDPQMRKIGFNLISFYETLRRCSILYQSPQVTKALEAFRNNVSLYLNKCGEEQVDMQALQACIHAIFFDLESMRFTRFKGFQDKARTVKKQLQQTLKQSEFGIECLKNLQMSPRAKLSLKSKF